MNARRETRIHDVQILIRECQIQHDVRREILDECRQGRHIVCIYGSGVNLRFTAIQFFLQRITF